MLDELVVKSSDDIVVMKKTMEENKIAIEILENKIDKINEELDRTRKEIEDKGKVTNMRTNSEKPLKVLEIFVLYQTISTTA